MWVKPTYTRNLTSWNGLAAGWEASVRKILAQPGLPAAELAGVFLGDELCCDAIPAANLSSVARSSQVKSSQLN